MADQKISAMNLKPSIDGDEKIPIGVEDAGIGNLAINPNQLKVFVNQGSLNGFTGPADAIWTGVGLFFDAFASVYYILGVQYPADEVSGIELGEADPDFGRFDAFIVNASGITVKPGDPSANPLLPQIDPDELLIKYIFIPAGATTPGGITQETVYNENTEWTGTTNAGGVDFEDTADPATGTKHISSGTFSNANWLEFENGSALSVADFTTFGFFVKLTGTFATNAGFSVQLLLAGVPVTSVVNITSGNHNFVRTNTTGYQQILVNVSEFTLISGSTFDQVLIRRIGSGSVEFYMDLVRFQAGVPGVSTQQDALKTIITNSGNAVANQPDDTFQVLGAGGTFITASGKLIYVYGVPEVEASGTDTYTGTLTGLTGAGNMIRVKIPNANTGAATFNLNSSSAKAIKKTGGTEDVAAGDLKAGGVYIFHDDGTNWQVIGVGGGGAGLTAEQEEQLELAYLRSIYYLTGL
jgi:hypothetical protein